MEIACPFKTNFLIFAKIVQIYKLIQGLNSDQSVCSVARKNVSNYVKFFFFFFFFFLFFFMKLNACQNNLVSCPCPVGCSEWV